MDPKTLKKIYSDYLKFKHIDLEVRLKEFDLYHLFKKIIPVLIENGYRNRAKFQVFRIGDLFLVLGTDPLLGRVSWDEAAMLLPEWGREVLQDLVEMIEVQPHFLPVDGFELQLTHGREEAHIVLAVNRKERGVFNQIIRDIMKNIPKIKGAAIPSQKISIGREELYHCILEQNYYSHYSAFFQSNLQLTPLLLLEVKKEVRTQTFDRIIDLFCGAGLFSLYLRNNTGTIIGVDIERCAVESARKNAEQAGAANTEYLCCPVQKWVEKNKITPSDMVILDPPRSGCPESVVQAVGEQSPQLICLISCYPETYFRDLKIWRTLGWKPVSFQAFDMFPFTNFLETVAFLRR